MFSTCILVQILLLYLPVNCAEGEQDIRAIQGCFSYVFSSTTFVHSFDYFVHSVVEKIYFLDVNFFSHG